MTNICQLDNRQKEKRSASMRGQKRSAESRAKMSAWQVGREMSDEAKAKMSAAAKARLRPKATEEDRARMRAVWAVRKAAKLQQTGSP